MHAESRTTANPICTSRLLIRCCRPQQQTPCDINVSLLCSAGPAEQPMVPVTAAAGPSPLQADAALMPPLYLPPPSPSLISNRVLEPGNATADGHIYNGAIERCCVHAVPALTERAISGNWQGFGA